jgi:hypothetical protein
MTTIITRLYSDEAAAAAVAALVQGGVGAEGIRSIPAGEGAMAAMRAARVSAGAAAAYAGAMRAGQTLVVAEVGFNPVGAARRAMKILARHPSVDVGLMTEDEYIEEIAEVETTGTVISGGKLVMSNPFARPSHGHILGANPLLPSRTGTSAIRGGGHMSKAFWPMKLVSSKSSSSAMSGTWLLSNLFGLPTIIRSWAPRDQVPTKI